MESKNERQFRLGTKEQSALLFFYTKTYKSLCWILQKHSIYNIHKEKNIIGLQHTSRVHISPCFLPSDMQINRNRLWEKQIHFSLSRKVWLSTSKCLISQDLWLFGPLSYYRCHLRLYGDFLHMWSVETCIGKMWSSC